MKKINKTFILLSLTTLIAAAVPVQANQTAERIEAYFPSIQFTFDGKQLAPIDGQKGFIYEGSTYVPLRFIAYALHKGVQWNSDSYTVSISEPNDAEKITIQEYNLNREVREQSGNTDKAVGAATIEVYKSNVTYLFDNVQKQPDDEQKGVIYEDVLYVPIRFVSESVGRKIDWNPDTYTVSAVSQSNADATPTNTPNASSTPTPSSTPSPTPSTTPSPTPSTTPVVIGGGGGGGGSVSKPSYDSIISEAEGKIESLRNSAEKAFDKLVKKYKAATTDAEKTAIQNEGSNLLGSYDRQFETIMSSLESKLNANEYSTDAVQSYREQYKAVKAEQMLKIISSLSTN